MIHEDVIFNADEKFEYPEHEMFIYSLLLGQFGMAKLFCLQGEVKKKTKTVEIDLSAIKIYF